jgi:hypothetical protein
VKTFDWRSQDFLSLCVVFAGTGRHLAALRPRMAMQQVGIALGLPGAARQSETELALLKQVNRQDSSKGVTKFFADSAIAAEPWG